MSMTHAMYNSMPFIPSGMVLPMPFAASQQQLWFPPSMSAFPMQDPNIMKQYPSSGRKVPDDTMQKRQHNPYAAVAVDDTTSTILQTPWQQATPVSPTPQQPQQRRTPTSVGPYNAANSVSADEVIAQAGQLVELSRTANGSSFIQAALREGSDETNLQLIWNELEPQVTDLLLDAHGCYVVKSLMERLPPAELQRVVELVSMDEQLVFSMCTHSLHTRRVVQFLLDSIDCSFILKLLTSHCAEIATTQQGCIIMQRAMDIAVEPARTALFGAIYENLYRFSMDPFGNYVVQHVLEVGERNANSNAFVIAFSTHVVEVSCNKFASNVVEKALFHLTPEAQHTLLMEMYDGGDELLFQMLQDSFGNYIIQSSIALAPFRDVFYMSEKLRPVLQRTPYGHKIEARLDRRLKGKPVGTRSPMTGPYSRGAGTRKPAQQGGNGYASRNNNNSFHSTINGSDDFNEEPW